MAVSLPRYPRGSEWRRWDLQIHTPYSALHNGFGDDFDAYAQLVLERAAAQRIAVIGLTDYFSLEGYKALRELLQDYDRLSALVHEDVASYARDIVLIPNIEFRARDIVTTPSGDARVNFHVLFSEEVAPADIDEHFLRELRFTYEADPDGPDQRMSLTLQNLEELGRRLKVDHAEFQSESDLKVGMMTAVVNHEDVTEILERQQARFKDRFLFVVPADEDLAQINWNGQGHLVRKVFFQKAHMLFSSNASTRAFGLGRKHPSVAAFEEEFKSRKACVHGSDAHSPEALFIPAEKRYLWIRADPTFQGLRQLLHEPEDRVFIGEEPPQLGRVVRHATKYLDEVHFKRAKTTLPDEKWFAGQVLLNAGLIALIGNKGSGKSALADVLALLGDSRAQADFSFLSKERFLAPKRNLGELFEATLTWRSEDARTHTLADSVDLTAPERVKYIPQNYLEKVCTELRESPDTAFDRELQEVIFSHVEESDRLGRETLPELLAYRTSEREAMAAQLLAKLAEINRQIVGLEDQSTEDHRKRLEGQLAQRRAELKTHDDSKPAEVVKPTEVEDKQLAEGPKQQLADVVKHIEEIDDRTRTSELRLNELSLKVAAADRLLARIANLESALETFHVESGGDASTLGLDVRSLVALAIDRAPIEGVRTAAIQERDALRQKLDPQDDESLVAQRRVAAAKADEVRDRLDEPNRQYQQYLQHLAAWTQRREEILGAEDVPGSVHGLKAQVANLDAIPNNLKLARERRTEVVRDIFVVKEELLSDYKDLYSPVQNFIDNHPVSQETDALQFSASMAVDGLVERLLAMIHQGKRGSFQGDSDGRERLVNLREQFDLSSLDGVERFLGAVEHHLSHDVRVQGDPQTELRAQLRQGVSAEDVYNFVFGLTYLRPRFELRWRGKTLDQLSPGERGTLLLIFYLLIDRRDDPLIIDQPEENLDNETITALLVPAIKYAKARRQIIIVTHNPNLAVVCDADQVVHASIDKTHGNRITYTSGSIEDLRITALIVDVLEGTKPAFDLRDARYDVLDVPQ